MRAPALVIKLLGVPILGTGLKIVFALLGTIFFAAGVAGILLPILPGMIFLPVSGFFFSHSIPPIARLINRAFGKHIARLKNGLSPEARISVLSFAFFGIMTNATYLANPGPLTLAKHWPLFEFSVAISEKIALPSHWISAVCAMFIFGFIATRPSQPSNIPTLFRKLRARITRRRSS